MLYPGHFMFSTLKKSFILSALFCVLTLINVDAACPAHREVLCPCGQTGNSVVTLCDSGKDDPCEKFKFCETCSEKYRTCATCPQGQFGRHCTEGNGSKWENVTNHIEESTPGLRKHRSKRGVCPDLQSPKFGTIRCWFSQNERECTGRCFPDHFFPNHEEHEEIVLKCIRDHWEPESSFPSCISEGNCELEMIGAGNFNCTTNSRGTFCDIRCTGRRRVNVRSFCYPGHSWEPHLPYCIRKKEIHDLEPHCSDPGDIANGERMDSEGRTPNRNELYEEGSTMAYSCRTGFALVGQHLLTCESSGSWSSAAPICQRIRVAISTPTTTTEIYDAESYCSDPGDIANGERMDSEGRTPDRNELYEEGSTMVYSCRAGFSLVGQGLLTCQSSGSWSSQVPICQRNRVSTSPLTITTAKPKVQSYCPDPGFVVNGNRWTTEGRTSSRGDNFGRGTSVVFSCQEDYALEGLSILTCLPSRRWSNTLPACKQIHSPHPPPVTTEDYDEIPYCPDPGSDENAERTERQWADTKRVNPANPEEEQFPQGFRLYYKCKEGYVLKGESSILCYYTGLWSAEIPTCEAVSGESGGLVYCPDPGFVENGRRIVVLSLNERKKLESMVGEDDSEYPEGVKLQYICSKSFRLVGGHSVIRCNRNGKWSDNPPDCLADDN